MPKTPGKTTSGMISDPARVSHLPVRQSVRHPSGVAGIEPHRNPESSGLRPSTSGLNNEHPCRGATRPSDPHPWDYGGAPVSRWYAVTRRGVSVLTLHDELKCVTPDVLMPYRGGKFLLPVLVRELIL